MGNNFVRKTFQPDVTPDCLSDITHDPQEGFDFERKPREKKYTDAEMNALKIPHEYRDYCAHLLIPLYKCRDDNFPFFSSCKPQEHEYMHCQYEDRIIRMKEWERERRLRIRDKQNGTLAA